MGTAHAGGIGATDRRPGLARMDDPRPSGHPGLPRQRAPGRRCGWPKGQWPPEQGAVARPDEYFQRRDRQPVRTGNALRLIVVGLGRHQLLPGRPARHAQLVPGRGRPPSPQGHDQPARARPLRTQTRGPCPAIYPGALARPGPAPGQQRLRSRRPGHVPPATTQCAGREQGRTSATDQPARRRQCLPGPDPFRR
ncbi:hypothetical protein D3C81_1572800 [compost metagenome]